MATRSGAHSEPLIRLTPAEWRPLHDDSAPLQRSFPLAEMDTTELLRIFILIILPAFQSPFTSIAISSVVPALLPLVFQHSSGQAATLILSLKYLFPHRFREYHSPFYVEPRSPDLWENYMLTSWSDQKFRETFRMNRACFHELCGILAPQLQGGHSNFKESLSVARKVAISLYRLSGEVIP